MLQRRSLSSFIYNSAHRLSEFVRYRRTEILESENEFVMQLQTKPLAKPIQPRGSVSYQRRLWSTCGIMRTTHVDRGNTGNYTYSLTPLDILFPLPTLTTRTHELCQGTKVVSKDAQRHCARAPHGAPLPLTHCAFKRQRYATSPKFNN